MAPCLAGVNAAHEPRPAAGGNAMPSTVTLTSARDQARRTTPSFVVVGLDPAAWPILAASSCAPPPPAVNAAPIASTLNSAAPRMLFVVVHMDSLLSRSAAIGRRPPRQDKRATSSMSGIRHATPRFIFARHGREKVAVHQIKSF